MKPFCDNLEALEQLMLNTEQIVGLNMLEHGRIVASEYARIVDNEEFAHLSHLLLDRDTMFRYHLYHDCGKGLVASEGKFPAHAEASAKQWEYLFPNDCSVIALMRHDMDFHTLKGDDIRQLWSDPLAPSLYVTAWAELYANASMFGGTDTDSFKIKRKRLIQAGKKMA
jgi:hypothetical protein